MSNPVRPCPACQVFDDHPRHVVVQPDQTEVALHMDCCAGRGCHICAHMLDLVSHEPDMGIVGDVLRRRLEIVASTTTGMQVVHAEGVDAYGPVTVSVL